MSELNNSETDWMCACGNINYRFRKYCNLRKCQLPQIGNPFLFFGINQLIKAGYNPQSALSLLLTNSPSPAAGSLDMMTGNPQLESQSGHAPETPDDPLLPPSTPGQKPEGCWQCASCGNLNWPWRDACNRKGCQQLKKESLA
jgi:hypothetical protein